VVELLCAAIQRREAGLSEATPKAVAGMVDPLGRTVAQWAVAVLCCMGCGASN